MVMDDVIVEHAMDREHASVSVGAVYFQLWAGACTPAAADGIDRTLDELLVRYPQGIAIFGASRPGVSVVPPGDVRERLAETFKRHASGVRCIATVIAGEGFIAATKRAVVATIAMLARQPIPLQIFDEPGPPCRWVYERLESLPGRPSSAAALQAALVEIERRYDAFLTRA
jgi:hypothetical protein